MRYAVLVILMVLGCENLAVVHALESDQRESLRVESLRGLPGVEVIVEDIKADATTDGLSREAVQTAVELILRSNGIKVLAMPTAPYLYVNISTMKEQGVYLFCTHLALKQIVRLLPERNKEVFAATWSAGELGSVGKNKLHQVVSVSLEPLVKRFANDFLTANPRK